MADNLSHTAATGFSLPDHAIIALEGPDATAFAHAQFANDVAALVSGQWQWNAWLTPKGRVIALFALLKPAQDRILLMAPDYPADLFVEQLRRFVFRRKLKIEARSDLAVQGTFAAPSSARGANIAEADGAIELDFGTEGGQRTLRIGPATATLDASCITSWLAFDLAHGLPRLPESQREQWTPQQLSLERLPAFSVKKGCYPGQEIVARTHFLGQAKRELVLLEADAQLAADMDVESNGKAIGKIVCATSVEPWRALAVLPLERGSGALDSAGIALQEAPLRPGLHR